MAPKANQKTTTYTLIQILCSVAMFVILAYWGLLKMGEDFWQLFQWWMALVMLGIAFYPLTAVMFRHFDDRGYLFSKAIGIMAAGWLMWVLSSMRILPFTTKNCYLCLGICAGCNYLGVGVWRLWQRSRIKKENADDELIIEGLTPESGESISAGKDTAKNGETVPDDKQALRNGEITLGRGQEIKAQETAPANEQEAKREESVSARKDMAEDNKYVSVVEQIMGIEKTDAKAQHRLQKEARAPKKAPRISKLARKESGSKLTRPVEPERREENAEHGQAKAEDCAQTEDGTIACTDEQAADGAGAAAGVQAENKLHWERIIFLELLFFMAFLFFMYIKGFNPKAYGNTEKMMDYGFMTSMYKTMYFPVEDFWFAGESLNYYYFGQYLMTFITKLAFTTVPYGYNLAVGVGFAFCVALVYSMSCQIMKVYAAHKKKKFSGAIPHAAGAIAALAVAIAGNGHYIVFGKLVPALWDILQIQGDKPGYWFPSSTRYIGYIPDTRDKTIHEFPSYSFILGDLHAHVINITFVLTIIAVLFSFLLGRKEKMALAVRQRRGGERTEMSFVREVFQLPVFAVGFMIGIFMMTNYWDFPIYFIVSGAVILVSNAIICGFDKRTWILTAAHAVIVLGVGFAVALPFNIHFVPMANGFLPTETHTPLYQLIILWGIQFFVVIGFVIALVSKQVKKAAEEKTEKHRFFAFLENLHISDLFVLILGLCAIGLVFSPEVVYMSDIYGGEYKRSNTMFKLAYQAYILFGLAMGYILTRFILLKETRRQLGCGIVGLFMVICTCGYFPTGVKAWFGDITNEDEYKGMRADQYIYEEAPMDALAIDWLNGYIEGRPVMLEANGDSYTIYNRVSVLTGMPTVLGWHTHEWLWHNDVTPVDARAADIRTIYTSQDTELVRSLLRKYNVSYIFIGSCEYEKYWELGMNVETLKSLGEVIYTGFPDINGQVVTIVEVN